MAAKRRKATEEQEPATGIPRAERRRLLVATGFALLVAFILLVVAILPAEYGVDPTGIGGLLGLTKLRSTGQNATNESVATRYVFQGTWLTEAEALGVATGYSKSGSKRSITFENGFLNLTRVVANLTWTDANQTGGQPTDPDIFEVQVQAPDGRVGTAVLGRNPQPGGAGSVQAAFDLRPPPATQEVEAEDAAEAQTELVRRFPADGFGLGTWRVNVTLAVAGGSSAGGVPVGGSAVDDGNDWQLAVAVETYRLDAQRLKDARIRTDTTTITVGPGQGLEFKLHVNESQSFDYSWNAGDTSVFFDLHGERDGDTSGAFTSHKRGSATRDSGTVVAPFTGTHGWYFENQGRNEATVNLTVKGVYTVVGLKQ